MASPPDILKKVLKGLIWLLNENVTFVAYSLLVARQLRLKDLVSLSEAAIGSKQLNLQN